MLRQIEVSLAFRADLRPDLTRYAVILSIENQRASTIPLQRLLKARGGAYREIPKISTNGKSSKISFCKQY